MLKCVPLPAAAPGGGPRGGLHARQRPAGAAGAADCVRPARRRPPAPAVARARWSPPTPARGGRSGGRGLRLTPRPAAGYAPGPRLSLGPLLGGRAVGARRAHRARGARWMRAPRVGTWVWYTCRAPQQAGHCNGVRGGTVRRPGGAAALGSGRCARGGAPGEAPTRGQHRDRHVAGAGAGLAGGRRPRGGRPTGPVCTQGGTFSPRGRARAPAARGAGRQEARRLRGACAGGCGANAPVTRPQTPSAPRASPRATARRPCRRRRAPPGAPSRRAWRGGAVWGGRHAAG
jgi:translation initiation factor IF-2